MLVRAESEAESEANPDPDHPKFYDPEPYFEYEPQESYRASIPHYHQPEPLLP